MSDPPDRHSVIPNETPTLPVSTPKKANSHRPRLRLLHTPSDTTASDNGHTEFTLWNSLERLRKSLKPGRRRRSTHNVGQVVTLSKSRRSTRILLYRTEPSASSPSPEPTSPASPYSHTPPERLSDKNATQPHMVQQPNLHVRPSSESASATEISTTTLGHFVFTAVSASAKSPATPSLPQETTIPSPSASPSKTLGHFTIVAPTNPFTSASSPRDPPSQLSPTNHVDVLCSPVTPRDEPSRRWGIDAPAPSPSPPPPLSSQQVHRNTPHMHAQSPSYIPEYRQTHVSLERQRKDIIPDSWFSSPMQKSAVARSPSKTFTMSPMSHLDELASNPTPTSRHEAFHYNPQLTSPPRRSRNSAQSPVVTAEKPPLPTMPTNYLGRRNTHQRLSGMSESPMLTLHQSLSRRNTHQPLSTMSEKASVEMNNTLRRNTHQRHSTMSDRTHVEMHHSLARRNTHQRHSSMSDKASVEMNTSLARRNTHQRLSDMLEKVPVPLQQDSPPPRDTYQKHEQQPVTTGHVEAPKYAVSREPPSDPPSQLYASYLSEVSQTPSANQFSQQYADESSPTNIRTKPKKEKLRHDFFDDFESDICEADLAPNVRPSDDDLSELHRIFPKSHVLQLLHDTSRKAAVLKDKLLSSVMYSPMVYPIEKGGRPAHCSRCSGFNVNVSITPRGNSSAKGENGLKQGPFSRSDQ